MAEFVEGLTYPIGQQMPGWWTMRHLPALVFAFCFGACVGSFINVVAYRLPEGMSIISPPSRCPTCGARLTWRENFPIFGWLLLRGKCRTCGVSISPQYMLIELFIALLFLGLTILIYVVPVPPPWEGSLTGPWWRYNGIWTLPAFIAILILFSSLVAMTLIDAKTFVIPIQIPLVATIVAFAAYGTEGLLQQTLTQVRPRGLPNVQAWPIPLVDWTWFWAATGGMAGLAISIIRVKTGRLRYSFADYDEYVKEGEVLADYPHARREMWVELLYLLPCLILLAAGFAIGRTFFTGDPPIFLRALGGCAMGYLVGGGVVWTVRILGTLGFGREAMGMGDVHLMAAVGATLGWRDPVFIFFAAAFVGLAWVIVAVLLLPVFKKIRRELPYGPHLAVATLLVLLLHPVIYPDIWEMIMQARRALWP